MPRDEIDIQLSLDSEPRHVAVPPELAAAFDDEPEARTRFKPCPNSAQQRLTLPIENARTTPTRHAASKQHCTFCVISPTHRDRTYQPPRIACETRIMSGVQQHDGDQRRERDKSDHEEQDEVPLMASRPDRPRRLGG